MFAQRENGKETSKPGANGTDVPSSLVTSGWLQRSNINRLRDTSSSDHMDLMGSFMSYNSNLREVRTVDIRHGDMVRIFVVTKAAKSAN